MNVTCPHCGKVGVVPETAIGKMAHCKGCRETFKVTAGGGESRGGVAVGKSSTPRPRAPIAPEASPGVGAREHSDSDPRTPSLDPSPVTGGTDSRGRMVWLAFGTTGLIVMGLALLLIARRPATEPTASGPSNTQKALLTQAGSRSMPPVAARRPTPAGDNQAPSDATKTVPSAEPSPEQPVAPVAARRPTPAGDNQAPSNVTIENGPNGLILKPLDARVRMNDDGTMNVTLVSARSSGDGLDFGLEHLSGMKNIRSLGFGLPLGVDEALRTLPNISLPGLERLCLGSTMVSDNGVANLKGMSGLKEINLERTAITDAGLAHLAGLTNLESLNLERTRVTDAGLKSLQGMINLRELVLDGTRITNPGLENLAGLTKMEELSIEFNDKLTGGLKNLSGMAHLKKLIIGHTNIGDDELAHLSGMRNLEEIYLDSTPIGDAGLDHLRHIISLKGVFTSFSKVTPEGKARLKKSLPGARIEGY